MKKIKRFYKNNRIYIVLMSISLLCLLLIVGAFVFYFMAQLNTDSYGRRLVGKENILISNERKEATKKIFTDDEKVVNGSVLIQGKIIYIDVILNKGTVSDAQSLAIKSLDVFTDDEKEFYDVSFTFIKEQSEESDPTFPIIGYKKSSNTIISWVKTSSK